MSFSWIVGKIQYPNEFSWEPLFVVVRVAQSYRQLHRFTDVAQDFAPALDTENAVNPVETFRSIIRHPSRRTNGICQKRISAVFTEAHGAGGSFSWAINFTPIFLY